MKRQVWSGCFAHLERPQRLLAAPGVDCANNGCVGIAPEGVPQDAGQLGVPEVDVAPETDQPLWCRFQIASTSSNSINTIVVIETFLQRALSAHLATVTTQRC